MAVTEYCDQTDVTDLTGFTYDTTTQPTADDVTEIIQGISAEINSILKGQGYTVPVVGENDLALMKRIAKQGSACEAWHAMVTGDKEFPRAKKWCSDYQKALADLKSGAKVLPDQDPETGLPNALGTVELEREDGFHDNATDSEFENTIIHIEV